jgi:hypothetical protein
MAPEVAGPAPQGDRPDDQAATKPLNENSLPAAAGNPQQRDAAVTRVTPKTPAERARKYRKRKRDAVIEALVTPQTVTPATPDLVVPPIVPASGLSKGEREDLAKLARQWGRLSKQRVDVVKAEMLADAEARLSEDFSAYDEAWADATSVVEQKIRELDGLIDQVCEERGTPKQFRPGGIRWWFMGRGENTSASRRAELRKLAAARLDQAAKAAKLEIDAKEVATVTNLYVGGLTSDAARGFLANMPDPRSLMPDTLDLDELGQGGGS